MAIRHILVRRGPEAVWGVLADPEQYSAWVPGALKTTAGQGQWPQVGATLEFSSGLGRWKTEGRTVVRISEPPYQLELEACLARVGSARIAVRIVPWGEDTLVIVDEHPLRGPAAALHAAPFELLLQFRHRRMLAQLAGAVERAPRASEASEDGHG